MIGFLILIAIIALVGSLLAHRYKVNVLASANAWDGVNFTLTALHPILRVDVTLEQDMPFLTLHVFKLRVFNAPVPIPQKKGRALNKARLLRAVALSDMELTVTAGLQSPFETGILCAAFAVAFPFVSMVGDIQKLTFRPDFFAWDDSFRVQADANFSLGHTMVNYAKGGFGR